MWRKWCARWLAEGDGRRAPGAEGGCCSRAAASDHRSRRRLVLLLPLLHLLLLQLGLLLLRLAQLFVVALRRLLHLRRCLGVVGMGAGIEDHRSAERQTENHKRNPAGYFLHTSTISEGLVQEGLTEFYTGLSITVKRKRRWLSLNSSAFVGYCGLDVAGRPLARIRYAGNLRSKVSIA